MKSNNKKHVDSKLYLFFEKLWRFDTIKWRTDADFSKTFPQFLRSQWLPISIFSFFKMLASIYLVYIPIALAQVVQDQDITMLWIVLAGAALTYLATDLGIFLQFKWQTAKQYSLYTTANKGLLEADPMEHVTLSTGLIISKLSVFGRTFFSLVEEIAGSLASTIASILTVCVVFLSYDQNISLFLIIVFFLQIFGFSFIRSYFVKKFKPVDIHRRDKNKKKEISMITQKLYIRTIFATMSSLEQFKETLKHAYIGMRTQQMTYSVLSSFVAFSQLIVVGVVVSILFYRNVPAIEILALATALQRGSQSVSGAARTISKLNGLWLDTIDSWEFIQKNTNKTYPVID